MTEGRSVDTSRRNSLGALPPFLRIFVLPPLLTLALVVSTFIVFTKYLSFKSQRTTYVFSELQQARPCTLCHGGFFARSHRRIAALHFRLSTP